MYVFILNEKGTFMSHVLHLCRTSALIQIQIIFLKHLYRGQSVRNSFSSYSQTEPIVRTHKAVRLVFCLLSLCKKAQEIVEKTSSLSVFHELVSNSH